MSDKIVEFEVTAEQSGKRLDQFLAANIPDVSRVRVQQLIAQEQVWVNGKPGKRSLRLRAEDKIRVQATPVAAPLRAIPEDISIEIIYEDEHMAVVNKPAGMMVHAGAGASDAARNRGTLVNALLYRFAKLSPVGGEVRPGIVHRLDKQTSGLLVVAKTESAHRKLAEQFSRRHVGKKYIALVHGWMARDSGSIAAAISRDRIRRMRMTTRRSGGREARSEYKVVERLETPWGKFSLLEVRIATGRTHQIRVHLSSLGHSVVGDTLYGAPRELKAAGGRASVRRPAAASAGIAPARASLGRNFLHAASLELAHPVTGEALSFSSALPAELKDFLAELRRG
jgi:23S rRNA pseudouridine1911/1915/1917 synthase